jgi:hypothetical protein
MNSPQYGTPQYTVHPLPSWEPTAVGQACFKLAWGGDKRDVEVPLDAIAVFSSQLWRLTGEDDRFPGTLDGEVDTYMVWFEAR